MASDDIEQQPTLEQSLDGIGMEESNQLKEIFDMIAARASVVRLSYAAESFTFDYTPPNVEKLKKIKSVIESLSSRFVNMDYPYWEMNWQEFPQMYSADYIARDEEHNLNILPAYLSSFDDHTVAIYRNFLKNVVYWLKKFRYVRSAFSYYDMTFRRNWTGWKIWDPITGDYKYTDFRENNGSYYDGNPGEFARLMSSQQGYVDRSYPSIISATHTIQMPYNDRNEDRYFSHTSNGPLVEAHDEDLQYELRNVPHDLMTPNPTGYQASVYWYLTPGRNSKDFYRHTNNYQVTEKEVLQTMTWGNQQQFSADYYQATEGEREEHRYEGRNMDPVYEVLYHKQTYSDSSSDYLRTKRTRWSRDGERSYVYEDTTTYDPTTPSDQNNLNDDTWLIFGAGKVTIPTAGSQEHPRFLAGTVEPHDTLTYHFCEMNALPAPPEWPPYIDPGGEFEFGLHKRCDSTRRYYCDMYCILDFGDYVIPDPEEPGE